jgi:hypothetical protein
MRRERSWDGFYNARDLGGVPRLGGGTTSFGQFVRSADVHFVTCDGWRAAQDEGFTTVLDQREPDEVYGTGPGSELTVATVDPTPPALPEGMVWRHVPLDDHADRAFWEPFMSDGRWCTPLCYAEFLRAKGDRVASVFTALASAPAGTVFHCGAGRDRTGLVAALLLRLAGAEPDAVAADFALSADAVRPLFTRLGRPDQASRVEAVLTTFGTTARDAVLAAVGNLDVRSYLEGSGVSAADVDRLRNRLAG